MKKIIVLVLVMIVLTLAGDKLSSTIYDFQSNSVTSSFELIYSNALIILIINFLLITLDMLRMKLIGNIFSLKFSWEECFGGVILNLLFGWVSPMAILGAPAMAYYLFLRGYSLVDSLSVSFVRSFGIILVSSLTTMFVYGLNLQGPSVNTVLQDKVFQVLTGIGIYLGSIIFLSYLPFEFIKRIKFLNKLTGQIRLLLKKGKLLLIPILLLTLTLNFLLVSFIMYEGGHYNIELDELFGQVMLFLSYMLLMPTPGASGLAEIGAPLIFSDHIPRSDIISIVTAMRLSTIGVQVTLGSLFAFIFLKGKISFAELKKFRESKE